MAVNCTATLNLGCFPCSQPGVLLPFVAPLDGTYVVAWCYNSGEHCTQFEGVQGEPLVVPVGGLNEDYRHKFSITDPNGDRISYDDGTREYDCFTFRLQLAGPTAPPFDVRVLSCADLEGLGVEQVQCVIDTLDFADDAVFGLLSPSQIASLTTRLCDGAEVPTILPYANEAAALADNTTQPTTAQEAVLTDTKRRYLGDGTSTVAQLVAAKVYNLPVREDAVTGIMALDETGVERQIQLNQ